MMAETPQVVVRSRRAETIKEFAFTIDQVRQDGLSEPIRSYRQKAWQLYQTLKLPTVAEEAWRRTDLRPLQAGQFKLTTNDILAAPPADLLTPLADQEHGGEILITPQKAEVQLSEELAKKGVVFTDLRTAETKYPALVEKILGQLVRPEEGKFAALTGALAQNGILLYVPRGVQIERPLHSLYWGPGKSLAHVTHLLVWLEEGSAVTYVHESSSPAGESGQALHSGIVEIHVGQAADLRFVELQSWGENVWNMTHERARVERDGNLAWIFGAIGSHLTKNFSTIDLVGQGATGKMSGFYFSDHDQHLDHDTQQNHLAPSTTSDLLFKGALLGHSRSVWQGMIYVAPNAPKTDGYQANRNLVLSPLARADSIPGLEILTDDVRCSHGATVGKIDQDEVFYLLTRGIPRKQAERLIVEGFFDPIMQRIPFEGVRQRFQRAIEEKMDVLAAESTTPGP
jgi:Fe-S cluster assembly protein SufD